MKLKKPKVLKKSTRQTKVEGHNYVPKLDNQKSALSPGKRISKTGNIYYEYRKNRSDVAGVDLPKKKKKVIVRKHTRKEGEIEVKKHDRELEIKKASSGNSNLMMDLSLKAQLKKQDEQILKGSRSDKFQDIGEKFGGAKKDYYSMKRQLDWDDILDLEKNTADALQFITKSKIIMPIDEQQEIANGTTAGAIYLKKLAYKYLANKPKINSKEARAFYFKESTSIFQSMINIRTVDHFIDFQNEFNRGFWTRNVKPQYYKERMGASFFGFISRTTRTSGEKVMIAKELENQKANIEKVDQLLEQKKSEERKKSLIYKKPYLENVERIGGKTISSANPDLIIKQLGLRGVEYGNWVNDKEAQKNVKYFIASMYDLEDMTGLNISQINKDGKLGIAFGSRGSGSALAHFEPYRNVINLTKKNGDGSLAHEWGHFLDHLIKSQYGDSENNSGNSATFLTSDIDKPKNKVQQELKELMETIETGNAIEEVEYEKPKGYKPSYSFQKKYEEFKDTGKPINDFFLMYQRKAEIRYKSNVEANAKLKRIYNLSDEDIEKRKKSEERKYKREISEIGKLIAYLEPQGKVKLSVPTGKSEYYVRSSRQGSGKSNSYWTEPHELFARAFEGFIQDKLKLSGRKNNYLANGTGSLDMTKQEAENNNFPYPQGEERKRINSKFENFLKVLSSGKGKEPIEIDHPSQQDSMSFIDSNSFVTRGEFEYLLKPENDGWRYAIKNSRGDIKASGWSRYREKAEIELSKAIRGVMY